MGYLIGEAKHNKVDCVRDKVMMAQKRQEVNGKKEGLVIQGFDNKKMITAEVK